MPEPQILAFGGGRLYQEPERPVLIPYLLAQTRKPRPRIGHIGTASGDGDRHTISFYSWFSAHDCVPSHLPLFARTPDIRDYLLSKDIIFVGGGNTRSMLAVWREWGLDEALREAWQEGVVLAGSSAGAICWFEQGVSDSWADDLRALPCLGFLQGSCCPHYDGEARRRPRFHELVRSGETGGGLAIDDAAVAHFVDSKLVRCEELKVEVL